MPGPSKSARSKYTVKCLAGPITEQSIVLPITDFSSSRVTCLLA